MGYILSSLIHHILYCCNYDKGTKSFGYFSNLPKSIYFVRHNDISPKDPVMKGLKPFGIGGILGNSSVKGFTLRDKELLGVEGGDPTMKGFTPFEIGDILGDSVVVKGFTLADTERLGVKGLQDWLLEAQGDIVGDP